MEQLQSIVFKILSAPLALIYGSVTSFRLFLYRMNIIRSSKFDIPILSVGNLTMGGSGKTPHVEYIIRQLQPFINTGILSRGYKRRTQGFRFVNDNDTVDSVGDEPLLYKLKYNEIPIAVGENRALAIPLMLSGAPQINTIIMDDAYQHIGVKPYINILLTEYNLPFSDDYIFPIGRLREYANGYNRADVIIVSKCPQNLTATEKKNLLEKIKPQSHQSVFFSYIQYGNPYLFSNTAQRVTLTASIDTMMLTGIASESYMFEYLKKNTNSVKSLAFKDHYTFTNFDVAQAKGIFDNIESKNKIMLTTEKDTTRLLSHREYILQNNIPLYILPIEVKFFDNDFDHYLKQKLLDFTV
jgi:tetraacyldisaccharide 4'-kinase